MNYKPNEYPITRDTRHDSLQQLRYYFPNRNIPKSPIEIEEIIYKESNGNSNDYLQRIATLIHQNDPRYIPNSFSSFNHPPNTIPPQMNDIPICHGPCCTPNFRSSSTNSNGLPNPQMYHMQQPQNLPTFPMNCMQYQPKFSNHQNRINQHKISKYSIEAYNYKYKPILHRLLEDKELIQDTDVIKLGSRIELYENTKLTHEEKRDVLKFFDFVIKKYEYIKKNRDYLILNVTEKINEYKSKYKPHLLKIIDEKVMPPTLSNEITEVMHLLNNYVKYENCFNKLYFTFLFSYFQNVLDRKFNEDIKLPQLPEPYPEYTSDIDNALTRTFYRNCYHGDVNLTDKGLNDAMLFDILFGKIYFDQNGLRTYIKRKVVKNTYFDWEIEMSDYIGEFDYKRSSDDRYLYIEIKYKNDAFNDSIQRLILKRLLLNELDEFDVELDQIEINSEYDMHLYQSFKLSNICIPMVVILSTYKSTMLEVYNNGVNSKNGF